MKPSYQPMLAQAAAPFDAEDYQFEVKWDGVRALAAVEAGGWRLWGRGGTDYTARYPELAVLQRLPAGTVVDGELVVLRNGRADFAALLSRHQRREPLPASRIPQGLAVSYMLFDVLVHGGRSILQEPLQQRRERLRELLAPLQDSVLRYSASVLGKGREYFAQAVAQGHEGVMAKHLSSLYLPGKRSHAWRKIKPAGVLPCVVIGYLPDQHEVQRVLLATVRQGQLQYVGRLSRGLDGAACAGLVARLRRQRRARAVVPCGQRACWVEPVLYCWVHYQGWTCHGHLRHAVFGGWLAASG
jgi:bifunctional non-homologous end joining protein LigD